MNIGYHSNFNFAPIVVPGDWTAKKDRNEFISRFGEPEGISYFDEVRNRIDLNIENLHDVLGRGLRYFGAANPPNTIPAKAKELEKLIRSGAKADKTDAGSLTDDYLDTFADTFRYLRTRWSDYVAIMKAYFCRDEGWLFPLVDLCDHLGSAALLLDEALCQYSDYKEQMGQLHWRF